MTTGSPRLVIAGLSGGSGKTIASLSILAVLGQRGYSVSAFKKGPDYIDPAWLSWVTRGACRNLDTYMVDPDVVLRSFVLHGERSDISVIEGNRGIFDGKDVSGTHSTAELAKLLKAPVVLVVDVTKATRTVAAVIRGCIDFDPGLNVAGIILNRVGGERHLRILREAIETYSRLPVLGAIPRLGEDSELIPGRHLGLVPPSEYDGDADLRSQLCAIGEDHLEIDGLMEIARRAPEISCVPCEVVPNSGRRVKIAYFRDSVFTFYYVENLEALESNGAELLAVSSLEDERLPEEAEALYIGGGFPETHAEKLARNRALMDSVKEGAADGMPIYAECGGLIYLARSLKWNDVVYPMSGLFPIDLSMRPKPVGHGYTSVRVDAPNPFYEDGERIRGHEFHYSGPTEALEGIQSCMAVESGVGLGDARDGLVYANTLACYTHVHADAVGSWASAMVSKAADYALERRSLRSANNKTHCWFESEAI